MMQTSVLQNGELFSVIFARYSELSTTLLATGVEDTATILGLHTLAETMFVYAFAIVGLECSFHFLLCF